jgi:hypothetical protein
MVVPRSLAWSRARSLHPVLGAASPFVAPPRRVLQEITIASDSRTSGHTVGAPMV